MECSVDGCTKRARNPVHGYCKLHYDRWYRHGDPTICKKPKSPFGEPLAWIERHVAHVGDECLIWPFARNADGRPHMFKAKPARLMCTKAHGAPPSGTHQAAHSCGKGNDGCVNPRHLRWATPLENAADKLLHGTGSSVLTPEDAREIRALKGTLRNIDIARRFGISDCHVANILSGAKWKDVA